MVSGEIAGMLQKNTETDFEQKVTEITEELGRNRSHHGTQGIKGKGHCSLSNPLERLVGRGRANRDHAVAAKTI
jgi:hypothetical protein